MVGIGSGNQISQTDQSHSGVYDSGNANVNYAPPAFPSFPFAPSLGASTLAQGLTGNGLVAVFAGLLVFALILRKKNNVQ